MKPYHGPYIPDVIPEKWRDDVSQTEWDWWCAKHRGKWSDISTATEHELTLLRAERCE